jgi:hypothetical protein
VLNAIEEGGRNDLILEELGVLLPVSKAAPAGQKPYLRCLQHLSLGRLRLGECFGGREFAFKMESPQFLKMVDCYGTTEFFEALLVTGLYLNLRSLKVTIAEEEWGMEGLHMFSSSPLGKVLASFSSLEELTILTNNKSGYYQRVGKTLRSTTETLPVSSHAKTLRRLIYQIFCTGGSDGSYVGGCDFQLDSRFPARNLLESLPRLECLGIWILPTTLVCASSTSAVAYFDGYRLTRAENGDTISGVLTVPPYTAFSS